MSKSLIAADARGRSETKFIRELDRLLGASIGVIAVRTREPTRAKLLMHQWSSLRGIDFHVWDVVGGLCPYKSLPVINADSGNPEIIVEQEEMENYLKPGTTITGTEGLIGAMDHFRSRDATKTNKKNRFCGVFSGIIDDWLKEPLIQQHIRDHVQRAYSCYDRIVLILAPGTALPEAIVADVEIIDLDTSSFDELRDNLNDLVGEISSLGYEPTDDDVDLIVQNALGMTEQEFNNSISLAIVDFTTKQAALALDTNAEPWSPDVNDFIRVIRDRKLDMLKQTNVLELMPEAHVDDIGGLDLLKADLALQRNSFSDEARAYGIKPPKGFLVVGPPGTGKSLLGRAASAFLGLPAIKFDMASVYGQYVGQSERTMRGALKMIEEMAPVVCFIDEIDKGIGSGGEGGGDSGVGKRVFGTLLTWMQEIHDKGIPVVVVASANNVTSIPPELLRKGRFNEIWAVSFPSAKERAEIFKIHLGKRGHKINDAGLRNLAAETKNYVGSEIESIVEKALQIDFAAAAPKVTTETLLAVARQMIPQTKAFPERIKAMSDWCDRNARPSSSGANFGGEPDEETKALNDATPTPVKRRPLRLAPRANKN